MNSLSKNQKIALGIIAILVIGVSAYFFFSVEEDPLSGDILAGETPGVYSSNGEIGADLLKILLDLKAVRLDEKFFQSATFTSLRNFEVLISPEPVGRKNPFIPLD